MKKIITTISILLLAIVFTNTSFGAVNIYMKLIDNTGKQILGESVVKGYEGWIEVSALSEGAANTLTTGGGGAPGVGKVSISEFAFQGVLSSASLPLQAIMYQGSHLNSVDIAFVYSTSNCTCPYYKIHLETVFITNLSGAANTDAPEAQQISFAPYLMAWAYYKQDPKTGAIPTKPTSQFAWDKTKNTTWTYSF